MGPAPLSVLKWGYRHSCRRRLSAEPACCLVRIDLISGLVTLQFEVDTRTKRFELWTHFGEVRDAEVRRSRNNSLEATFEWLPTVQSANANHHGDLTNSAGNSLGLQAGYEWRELYRHFIEVWPYTDNRCLCLLKMGVSWRLPDFPGSPPVY